MRRTLLVTLAVGQLACAAAIPPAAPDVRTRAVEFSPPTAKARLYVFRPDQLFHRALVLHVLVDGVMVASLAKKTFLVTDLRPGRHAIASVTNESASVVRIDAKNGEMYFLKLDAHGSTNHPRAALAQADAAAGRGAVSEFRMVETIVP